MLLLCLIYLSLYVSLAYWALHCGPLCVFLSVCVSFSLSPFLCLCWVCVGVLFLCDPSVWPEVSKKVQAERVKEKKRATSKTEDTNILINT